MNHIESNRVVDCGKEFVFKHVIAGLMFSEIEIKIDE